MAKGAGENLARFYPSMTDNPRPVDDAGPPFRRFVLDHSDEILEIGRTRFTQTNECRRCVALLPVVWMSPFERFHLVDVGTSAGLNLGLDRYRYSWDGVSWGPADGVPLHAESRGADPVPREIEVLSRIGLDRNPIDPSEPEERLWLKSLIWPEHHERRVRLEAALAAMESLEVEFVAGDFEDTIEGVLRGLPEGEPVVLMNSFSLGFDGDAFDFVASAVGSERAHREIFRISMEVRVGVDTWPELVVDDGTGPRTVGKAHHHGYWIDLD